MRRLLPRNNPLALAALAVLLALAGCSGDSGAPAAPGAPPAKAPAPAKGPAAKAPPPPQPAPVAFVYETKGRRDPFRPLIMPKVVVEKSKTAKPKTGLAALGVNELKVSGIVWDRRGHFAMVEAPNGAGYVLRVNDTIGEDTRVIKITPEAVTFEVKMETPLPQARSRQVELRLRKEE